MDMTANNGAIDGRFYTFQDYYGADDGIRFQGAVGYMVNESIPGQQPVFRGYGVAIDDMVLEWMEIRAVEDTSADCGTGSCATLDVAATQSYQSLGEVDVTVTDSSPGKPAGGNNDCNHNGVYTDAGIDSTDCDGNGRRDVYVKASSIAEPPGEWVLLDETSSGSHVFRGSLPVSSAYDSAGTLFVTRDGITQPVVTLQYDDPDDGTDKPCQRDPDPTLWGFVQAQVTLNVSTGRVAVKSSRVSNDAGKGDGDSFADTNETVNMYVTVSNKTGMDVTNLVARLASNSPYVDCVLQPSIVLPSLPKGAALEIPTPFVWKVVSSVNRQIGQEFADISATFNVTLSSDQFDAADRVQTIIQDLDLDVSGGGSPTTFIESFEGSGGPRRLRHLHVDVAGLDVHRGDSGRLDPSGRRHPLPVQRPGLRELELVRRDLLLPGLLPRRRGPVRLARAHDVQLRRRPRVRRQPVRALGRPQAPSRTRQGPRYHAIQAARRDRHRQPHQPPALVHEPGAHLRAPDRARRQPRHRAASRAGEVGRPRPSRCR